MIKRFYQEKLHFLPLFWFVIKNVDLFSLLFWILESLDPKIKSIIENEVQPFCLLEQTLFFMYLCVFLHK